VALRSCALNDPKNGFLFRAASARLSPSRSAGPSRGSILPPALHDRARVRVHPSQDDHARSRVTKASALRNPACLFAATRMQSARWRPVSCDVEGSDPARRRIQTDRRHLTLVTRISSFAGRVTEAALRGNTKSSAERVELRPAATRMTCSDVHASTARRHQGVRETASRGSPRFGAVHASRKRTCQLASSTRSLPNHVTTRTQQWGRARYGACSPKSRPPIPRGCTPA
jgi:hypothetical protein